MPIVEVRPQRFRDRLCRITSTVCRIKRTSADGVMAIGASRPTGCFLSFLPARRVSSTSPPSIPGSDAVRWRALDMKVPRETHRGGGRGGQRRLHRASDGHRTNRPPPVRPLERYFPTFRVPHLAWARLGTRVGTDSVHLARHDRSSQGSRVAAVARRMGWDLTEAPANFPPSRTLVWVRIEESQRHAAANAPVSVAEAQNGAKV